MNTSGEENDEMEIDSIAESNSESTPTDQEMERPPTQSGVATSSQPSSQTPSLTTVQRIAATLGEDNVPALITTQIQNLSESLKRKSISGLPLLAPKKHKLTHRLNPFPKPDSDTVPDTFPDPVLIPDPFPEPFPDTIPDPGYDADSDPVSNSDSDPVPNANPYANPDTDSDADPNPVPNSVPNPAPHFDILVSNSDRLPIAYDPAVDFFPATSPFTSEQTLQLTDPLGLLWPDISYVCFDEEQAFVLTHNWAQYAEEFNLRVMDTLRFRPEGQFMNHFMMQHFPRPESEPIKFPVFHPQNFLFQVELGRSDVVFGRLVILVELVLLCPGIGGDLRPEMLKLTDFRDKNWYVSMVYSAFVDRFMVMDGWPGFVREHDLVAGDVVRFYKPDCLSHEKHLLIQFERQGPTNAQK